MSGYCVARIGVELLRVDPAHHILGMRLNFWVASAVCLAGLIWFAWTQGLAGPTPSGIAGAKPYRLGNPGQG